MTPDGSALVDFPVGTFRSPTSLLFWGPHRYPLNRMLVAVSRRVDPGFLWLEIQDSGVPPEPGEPSTTGELGGPGLHEIAPADSLAWPAPSSSHEAPRPRHAPHRHPSPGSVEDLPSPLRDLIERVRPGKGPRALSLANLDRLCVVHSEAPALLRRVLEVARSRGFTLIASATSIPPAERLVFDHVLHVTVPAHHPWTESVVEVDKGPLGALVAERTPVRSLAPFAREFSGG